MLTVLRLGGRPVNDLPDCRDRAAVDHQSQVGRQRQHQALPQHTPRAPARPDQQRKTHAGQAQRHPAPRSARNRSRNVSRSSPVTSRSLVRVSWAVGSLSHLEIARAAHDERTLVEHMPRMRTTRSRPPDPRRARADEPRPVRQAAQPEAPVSVPECANRRERVTGFRPSTTTGPSAADLASSRCGRPLG